jgi:3-keto-L-gulonate-6-phosphate decarboxylase
MQGIDSIRKYLDFFNFFIVTVMGAASIDTLNVCYEVAEKQNKTMMIDLLEVAPSSMVLLSTSKSVLVKTVLNFSIARLP